MLGFAVIVAVPDATAVIFPALLTVATLVLLLDHVTVPAGFEEAVSVFVWPLAVSSTLDALNETDGAVIVMLFVMDF